MVTMILYICKNIHLIIQWTYVHTNWVQAINVRLLSHIQVSNCTNAEYSFSDGGLKLNLANRVHPIFQELHHKSRNSISILESLNAILQSFT